MIEPVLTANHFDNDAKLQTHDSTVTDFSELKLENKTQMTSQTVTEASGLRIRNQASQNTVIQRHFYSLDSL
jgi:hypothetical protein